MPARPWYPRNPGDYRRDTAHLTLEQHGAYNLLLDFAWDHDGLIPKDYPSMGRILGVHTNKARSLWGVLAQFWYESGGGYRQKRVDKELAKALEISKERAEYGRRGGLAKAKQKLKQNASIPQPQPDPEEEDLQIGQTTQIPTTKTNGADRFAEWWTEYPKKVKKKDAEKVWRAKHLDEKADELIADVEKRKREDRRWLDGYITDPTTYLRGERWEDEMERPKEKGVGWREDGYYRDIEP